MGKENARLLLGEVSLTPANPIVLTRSLSLSPSLARLPYSRALTSPRQIVGQDHSGTSHEMVSWVQREWKAFRDDGAVP